MQDDAAPPGGRKPSLERRLATILMADVVGYSKMVGENEERTIESLRGHREIFNEILKAHRGRVFNTAGDAILAEFPSAVDAVRCATEVQAALRTRNDHIPPDQRIVFRIGINLGDVIVQDGDLLGDGVNVAARIQTVAEPGGICISGSVYDQIQNKLSLQFRQMGEQTFKNIAQPIRTFSIADSADGAPLSRPGRRGGKSRLAAAALAVLALLVLGGGYAAYQAHESSLAEQARVAEVQRKADQERLATQSAEHESKLQAELMAARDALTRAEASKRKSDMDLLAAASAQREAKLQGELVAAKDALLKAEQSGRKADLDNRNASEALRAAEKASRPGAESEKKVAAVAPAKAASVPPVAPKADPAPAAGGVARFDGSYQGHFCNNNENKSGATRCWNAIVAVQDGKLTTNWPSKYSTEPTRAKGAIGPDGRAGLIVAGFWPDGRPNHATLSGNGAGDTITMSGHWRSGIELTANLTRIH
jgi:class 3 adenylate cyclase